MKKFVTCMLILSLSAAALSGCTITFTTPENSVNSEVSAESAAPESSEESTESSSEKSSAAESSIESSAEESQQILTPPEATGKELLFTWQIKLDGKTYTIPFDYSEVKALGYSIKAEED